MITEEEEKFYAYWSENRIQQQKSFRQFLKGLSSGIAIGVAILIIISIGWYSRANMEANTLASPLLIIICILIISVFMAFIYHNYQWEQKEQKFLELSAKKKKTENPLQEKVSE
jgi:predicted negative regulator of RcsB-dependent stress response